MLSREQELDLHRRLLDGDPIAPEECAAAYFEPLVRMLRAARPDVRDPQHIEEAAITALFDYIRSPRSYKPDLRGLMGYLRMAAMGDLGNALRSESRHSLRNISLDAVENLLDAGNDGQEDGLDLPPGVTAADVLAELDRRFTDPLDRKVIELRYIHQVRDTASFARALGIEHLEKKEQEKEVQRVKDRIHRRLRRMGDSFRGDV
ncbi:MAG: hypothetical protein U0531_08740 [Dehalococcoidia bacterium]